MVLGFRKHYVIKTQRKGTWSVPVGLVGLLLLAPSIWTAFHKWQKQHFERRVAVYVERIQLKYPDWVVVHHKAKLSKGHQSVDISLLNDRSEITDEELDAANQLDPSIDVLWHFAPDKASREAARLRRDLQRLDSLVQKQQRQIQQLQRLQQP